jgi:hypothetical protein
MNWIPASISSNKVIKKGSLVAFRFTGGNHIGIILKDLKPEEKRIHTFEFNTANPHPVPEARASERNGGWIGIRERERSGAILGFVNLN